MRDSLVIGFDAKRAMQNVTGLGNYSRLVINSLSSNYEKSRLILFAPKIKENPALEEMLERSNVELFTPRSVIAKVLPPLWRSFMMVKEWPTVGLDLYHGLSNELPLNVKSANCPTVVTIHDLIWHKAPEDYSPIDRMLYEYKYRRAAESSTRIIAVSQRTKDDLVEDWGIDPEKIDVIYQGCNPIFSQHVSVDKIAEVKRRYKLPEKYIVSVGTVQSHKNQLLAVRALRALPHYLKLVIIGKTNKKYKAEIKRFIDENRLINRVIWPENVPNEDLPAIYAGAVMSSYISKYEGFGIPIVESLSVGVPVIASTGSCLEEAGGDGALYIDPNNVPSYVETARAILDKPLLRRDLIEKGLKHVKKFNPDDFAAAMMNTYHKAISEFKNPKQNIAE